MKQKKNFMILLTFGVIFLLIFVDSVKATGGYRDLKEALWANEEILFLGEKGILMDSGKDKFLPNTPITRAEAAVMLVRAKGLPIDNPSSLQFSDVNPDTPGYAEIAAAVDAGIFMKQAYFKPDGKLTRGQMAKILMLAYPMENQEDFIHFIDVPKGFWAGKWIESLAVNRVTSGYPDGSFKPNNQVTRAQFAVFLARILDEKYRPEKIYEPKPSTPAPVSGRKQNYFMVLEDNLPVFDGRIPGKLVQVGVLTKGQAFPILDETDEKWHHIKFGNEVGLIMKEAVNQTDRVPINVNKGEANSDNIIITLSDTDVYDNSNGKLVKFATILENRRYPVISGYGNWYKVDVGGRVGFIHKSKVKLDRGIPVLMYHHVLKNSENRYFRNVSTTISRENFESQIQYLVRNGYETITLNELEKYIKRQLNLPAKAVVLTFDDGLRSVFENAYPIMKQYGYKASEFIVTNRMITYVSPFNPDILQNLSISEMEQMADVFEYHSHTNGLHNLNGQNKSDVLTKSYSIIKDDFTISKNVLNNTPYFAYPFGQYTYQTIDILKETGFRMALTTKTGYVKVGDDPYQIKRYTIYPYYSIFDFSKIVGN